MPAWLTAAANALRGKVAAPPQTYSFRCVCGQTVAGERNSGPQTIICPRCRTLLFILPASVYPLPKLPVPKPSKPAPRPREETRTREARTQEKRTPSATATSSPVREDTRAETGRPASPPPVEKPRPPKPPLSPQVKAWLRKKVFTPIKLVMAGVLAVVLLTVAWISHLRTLDRAEQTLSAAVKAGNAAIEEDDMPEAARQYELVRNSLKTLGRDDVQARMMLQTANETAAVAGLADVSLFDLLREAAESGADWPDTFRASYRGKWVVLDATVKRASGEGTVRRFEVDFPLRDGSRSGAIIADFTEFGKLLSSETPARRVIFAGQLHDCRHSAADASAWEIKLDGETGFVWSSPENLHRIGFDTDDMTVQLLKDQSRIQGLTK